MKYILKDISHFDFFEELQRHIDEVWTKLETMSDMKAEVIAEYRKEKVAQVKAYIKSSVAPETDVFVDDLWQWSVDILDTNFYSEYADYERTEEGDEIRGLHKFVTTLKKAKAYLSIVDTLLDPEYRPEINSMEDKFAYVLQKLNSLYGNDFYAIGKILELNDIKYRSDEGFEIASNLKKKGYVILASDYLDTDKAKISVKGVAYIERKLKQGKTQKADTQLNQKLDNVLAELTKLGLGQEVIFNEIEELRSLQHKLSKKSWAQLLKGKLIDMAVGKVLSKEMASTVYGYLVKSEFKLLDL